MIRLLRADLDVTTHSLLAALDFVDMALAASPAPARPSGDPTLFGPEPGINVGKLETVFAAHHGPSYFPGKHDVTIIAETPREAAEQIAAEYAALSSPTPDSDR